METLWRDEYCADTVAKCVGDPIKIQGPSGSLFRSVIWPEFFNIVQCHDVFVREVKLHGLIIFYSLMGQMISYHTSLYSFLGSVLYIILC